MSQLTYNADMAEAFAGMKADAGFDRVESFGAEELSAGDGLAFGVGVVAGTDASYQVKLPEADTETFRGISVHQHTEEGKYSDGQPVSVLRQGVIWMPAAGAIAIDAPVAIIVAAGATRGHATATTTGNITIGVARSAAAQAGDLIKVEINLP